MCTADARRVINEQTRARIKAGGLSVWIRVPLDTLLARVGRRDTRPLLRNGNPREILEKLLHEREPIYAEADLIVDSPDGPHASAVDRILSELQTRGLAG